MPRYFFDFDGDVSSPDAEGTEFPSPAEARREARQTLIDVARDRFLRNTSHSQAVGLSVRDAAGHVIYRGSVTLNSEVTGLSSATASALDVA